MMTEIIPGKKKRLRWLWLAGALFLCALLAIIAWNLTVKSPKPDLLTAAERAWLKAHPVIRLAPDPDFPPIEYFDKEDGYSGITADYVALLEKELGIRFTIVHLRDWNDIISKAKSSQIDVFVATRTPQRAKYMLFTTPFLEFPAAIIAREKVKGPLTLETLNGMRVSVVSEYAPHDFITGNFPHLLLDPVPDVRTGLRKVSFGLSDALVENLATASYYIEKEGIANLRIAGESGYYYRMGFCTRKDWPELNRILEKGLAGIGTSEKKSIYKKWIPVEPRSIFSNRKFQAGILAAFTAILAVVAAVIVWNRTLARQVSLRTGELENELAERKRVEEELKRARDELEERVEERTAKLAETVQALSFTQFAVDRSADQAFWMTNDGRFFYINDAACHALGYTREELVTMSVPDIDPICPPEMAKHYWEVLRKNGTDTFETCHRAKDGRIYPVEIRSNLLIFEEKEYNCCFVTDITARKQAEEALKESESRVRRKLESILDPDGDTGELDLADILDAPQIQALMEDLHRITGLKMSIIDLKGQVLADVGWQEICLKFHRAHPETLKKCIESDTDLAVGVPQGEFKMYRCKNNMWHMVTPIIIGERHMGNLFMGQFIFENEALDYDLFRSQARTYGFPEQEYIAALEAVPRHSEKLVNLGKDVFLRLTDIFSKLSYANIKLAHSVAERDRLTATLRQANLVVENSPVVLFRWKGVDTWPVELVSANIIQFGYSTDEFLSGALTYSSIIHPDDLERVTREVHDFCNEQTDQFRLEYRIITRWGDIRWVNEHSNIERDEASVARHFEGIVIDVTEHKLAEVELQQQKQLLQELNDTLERRVEEEVQQNREKDIMLIQQNRQAALGEMLDHIAHQWKQPLNSMSLIVQEMAFSSTDGDLTDESLQTSISMIMSLLEHMAQTIDVFRGFYRPDKERKTFSIKDSIDQALAFVSPSFSFQSIAVELDVEPGLTGFGYPKEYAQALLNILANARDVFRVRKTGDPRVILRGFAEGARSVVTITDNAGGVPETIKDRIFDFYFTTHESSGGTGIGLYMSKNIIEKNMAGTLSAENRDGGAQFRIEIPLY
ncbi:MAG: PocR ligand-binding domain-containing protein [Desulfuromonadales bacterium]|nr:PocR ligand-binding domain-containing protein [Desulfuromonadales bacterium]